ncbi:hypothetical protein FHR81_003022 [Actinoalloteichus hoggarensis]|uniref:Abi-like protein n=1 Tax=Actinoalloteichus hoggarensis TaxID=1470176 RepID=A0A221VYP3_9PSEU|nr:hypothetical protein [Actinoalloteichus hoggarensis]ASO18614.1 Abi-like protein [Actinoalloteichus hoggarensis]MBB5921982.1 hypothetical protein [Actinoalloteichus hoggarensis]
MAELSLGFWVSLISRGQSYDRTLWVPALHRAFPHYQGKRKVLHDNLTTVRLLRNRIMHHEPVFYRDLRADHMKIKRVLGYISPRMVTLLAVVDRVDEVLCGREQQR